MPISLTATVIAKTTTRGDSRKRITASSKVIGDSFSAVAVPQINLMGKGGGVKHWKTGVPRGKALRFCQTSFAKG
jgi:hypothetical protein